MAEPPHLVTPVLTGRDFPRDLLDQWPRGGPSSFACASIERGYVAECTVDRGTGVPAIDTAFATSRTTGFAFGLR